MKERLIYFVNESLVPLLKKSLHTVYVRARMCVCVCVREGEKTSSHRGQTDKYAACAGRVHHSSDPCTCPRVYPNRRHHMAKCMMYVAKGKHLVRQCALEKYCSQHHEVGEEPAVQQCEVRQDRQPSSHAPFGGLRGRAWMRARVGGGGEGGSCKHRSSTTFSKWCQTCGRLFTHTHAQPGRNWHTCRMWCVCARAREKEKQRGSQ